jgi:tetratricopeptide (TPR) repeat protein
MTHDHVLGFRAFLSSAILFFRLVTPHMVGVICLSASLAYWSPEYSHLDHFDLIKRKLLSFGPVLALAIGLISQRPRQVLPALSCTLAAMAWIIVRQFTGEPWDRELDIAVAWLLPFQFFLVGLITPPSAWRTIGRYLMVSLALQILLMTMQFWDRDPIFADWIDVYTASARMIGTVGYHNQAAAFVVLLLGVAWCLLGNPWLRLCVLVVVVLLVGLTGSRGAILGLVAAVGLGSLIAAATPSSWSRFKRLGVPALLLMMLALLMALPVSRARFSLLLRPLEPDAGVAPRWVMSHAAWSLWQERPVLGAGSGSFAYRYIDLLGVVLPEEKNHEMLRSLVFAREAHNSYLQFAAEFGWVGLVLMGSWLVVIIGTYWRSRRSAPRMASMGFFTLGYLGVHSLVSFPWLMALAGPLAGLMLGSAYAACSPSLAAGDVRSRVATRLCLCLALVWAFPIAWYGIDNAELMKRTASIQTEAEVRAFVAGLPRWGYRYRAYAGAILAEAGAYEEARPQLEWAALGYMDVWLLNNLGNVYNHLGLKDEARQVYERWTLSGLIHRDALYNLSVSQERLGDTMAALRTLERRRQLWPERNWSDDVRFAALAIQAQNPIAAQESLRLYLGRDLPSRQKVQIFNLYAAACLMVGNFDDAKSYLNMVLDLDPHNKIALQNLRNLSEVNKVSEPIDSVDR